MLYSLVYQVSTFSEVCFLQTVQSVWFVKCFQPDFWKRKQIKTSFENIFGWDENNCDGLPKINCMKKWCQEFYPLPPRPNSFRTVLLWKHTLVRTTSMIWPWLALVRMVQSGYLILVSVLSHPGLVPACLHRALWLNQLVQSVKTQTYNSAADSALSGPVRPW